MERRKYTVCMMIASFSNTYEYLISKYKQTQFICTGTSRGAMHYSIFAGGCPPINNPTLNVQPEQKKSSNVAYMISISCANGYYDIKQSVNRITRISCILGRWTDFPNCAGELQTFGY